MRINHEYLLDTHFPQFTIFPFLLLAYPLIHLRSLPGIPRTDSLLDFPFPSRQIRYSPDEQPQITC
jgi:hypothetical protein